MLQIHYKTPDKHLSTDDSIANTDIAPSRFGYFVIMGNDHHGFSFPVMRFPVSMVEMRFRYRNAGTYDILR